MVKCYHELEVVDNLLRGSNASFVLEEVDFKFVQQMSCLQGRRDTPVLSLCNISTLAAPVTQVTNKK